jgi:thiosulfate dehydrogenase
MKMEHKEHNMRNYLNRIVPLLGTSLIMLAALSVSGSLNAREESDAGQLMLINQGGLLYDNWYVHLGQPAPSDTHPGYTGTGEQGAASWRCPACHGWDYKGDWGGNAQDRKSQGITGIRNLTYARLESIVAVLKDDAHRFGGRIPEGSMTALAYFVAYGQIDVDLYIDRNTRTANGDPVRGARIYQTVCARCHGVDGKFLNFNTTKDPAFVGTVANRNPWRTLHKIRMGQPEVDMVSMLAFTTQDHVDVLAYAQALPMK